jgi:hypothetical protein
MTGWILLRGRNLRPLRSVTAALLAMVLLGLAWSFVLRVRREDPRLADKDTLSTHDIFKPLISGIGWTPNRWGITPWDPRVAQFLGDRLGLEPVPVYTAESERRAQRVYASLWGEAPGHLAKLYLARVPRALSEDFWMGTIGAALWLLASAMAIAWGWKRRDLWHSRVVVGGAVMVAALIAQSVVLDPRLLYAYPLRVISALALATSLTALAELWRSEIGETSLTAPQGEPAQAVSAGS